MEKAMIVRVRAFDASRIDLAPPALITTKAKVTSALL